MVATLANILGTIRMYSSRKHRPVVCSRYWMLSKDVDAARAFAQAWNITASQLFLARNVEIARAFAQAFTDMNHNGGDVECGRTD